MEPEAYEDADDGMEEKEENVDATKVGNTLEKFRLETGGGLRGGESTLGRNDFASDHCWIWMVGGEGAGG